MPNEIKAHIIGVYYSFLTFDEETICHCHMF